MEWLSNWWESLTLLQQCFACAAIPATILLLLQTILLLFGFGGHDADHGEIDAGHDLDHTLDHDYDMHNGAHHAEGVRIFTVRGLIAMFAVGGWLGVVMGEANVSSAIVILTAAAGGLCALFLVGFFLVMLSKLQENGNINKKNAISKTAKVYIPIPPNRSGSGKITFTLQERFVEMDAVTDSDTRIETDSLVQIVSMSGDMYVVRPLHMPSAEK